MMVLHVDAYQAGAVKGFEWSKIHLIGCFGMCSFAAMDPISNSSLKSFASTLMHIILHYGFYHTVVLNKDTKFMGVFKESFDLLNSNYHILVVSCITVLGTLRVTQIYGNLECYWYVST